MSFELEKDMTDSIKNKLLDIVKSTNNMSVKDQYIYAYEFPVYYRMIDITIASYCNIYNEFEESIKYQKLIRNLSADCFNILVLISLKEKTSLQLIEKRLLIEKNHLKECINKLEIQGLIKKVSKYSYKVTEWISILPNELIAIELKLSKWQEALEQGIFNQRFAEISFVILDKERIKNNKIVEKSYKESNVGLIYLLSDGTLEFRVIPNKNKNLNRYVNNFHKAKILKDFVTNIDKWKPIL